METRRKVERDECRRFDTEYGEVKVAKRLNRRNSSTDSKERRERDSGGLQRGNVNADVVQSIHIDIGREILDGGCKTMLSIEW